MPKELLNEAERFLLTHWWESRALEESMDGVRTKYKELFERIVEEMAESHPELTASPIYATQFWGNGSIGFGRKSWPGGETNWPTGFWIDYLRLEKLTSEDDPQPSAGVWVAGKAARKVKLDVAALKAEVQTAAQQLLNRDEMKRDGKDGSLEYLVSIAMPSKRELVAALLDGDGQKFIELIVSQLDILARFIPVLDRFFERAGKQESP